MRKIFITIFFACFIPFLLGNEDCQRDVTWGEAKTKIAASLKAGHPEIDAKTNCTECHENVSAMKPQSHDISWKREHGKYAQTKYGYRIKNICSRCHQESTCTECHQQEAPQSHTQYWKMTGHRLGVGVDRRSCMACHNGADFCERCHSERKPVSHTATWGSATNRHCLNCHETNGLQTCGVCHANGTTSHTAAPVQPTNAFHVAGASCRSCHAPLSHSDNGQDCTDCHP